MKRTIALLLTAAALLGSIGCAAYGAPDQAQSIASTPTADTETTDTYDEMCAEYNKIYPNSTFIDLADTDRVQPYLAEAEARKDEILHSKTAIVKSDTFVRGETYTGTAYYLSPNGNDESDGLSPETAVMSLWRATGLLQPGDALFFERGYTYRLTNWISMMDDVTYSAYGDGEKPVLTMVDENSARAECWNLYYEDATGVKVWEYYKDVTDTGGIVFDDETYASRVYEWPTTQGWEKLDLVVLDAEHGVRGRVNPFSPYDIAGTGVYNLPPQDNLPEDMTFLSRTDISNITYPTDFASMKDDNIIYTGKLYLRCDTGNPGELYDDIEVLYAAPNEAGGIIEAWANYANGFVLDNLSLKYFLDNAVGSAFEMRDAVIQNCTVAWGGNRLFDIQSEEPTVGYMLIGDGIYGVAANATIRNNYMKQCGNGVTFENVYGTNPDLGYFVCENNVMEDCAQGIRLSVSDDRKFETIELTGNIILNCGYGFNNACWEQPAAIDLGAEEIQYAKSYRVTNNVVIGGQDVLMYTTDLNTVPIEFDGNVFIQKKDANFAQIFDWEPGEEPCRWLPMPR